MLQRSLFTEVEMEKRMFRAIGFYLICAVFASKLVRVATSSTRLGSEQIAAEQYLLEFLVTYFSSFRSIFFSITLQLRGPLMLLSHTLSIL